MTKSSIWSHSLRPEPPKASPCSPLALVQSRPETIKVAASPSARLGAETRKPLPGTRLGDLWDTEPRMVLNDEGHHAYRPAPQPRIPPSPPPKRSPRRSHRWVSGLDKINAACGHRLCLASRHPILHPWQRLPEGCPFLDRLRFQSGGRHRKRHHQIPPPGHRQHRPPDPKYFKLWEHITRDLKAEREPPAANPSRIVYSPKPKTPC